MKFCVPTIGEGGLSARLSPHFGSAPYFTLVESEGARVSVVTNERARHEHGRCDPARALQGLDIGAVVCRGLGRRALMALNESGIDVLVTECWTVEEALAAFRSGALVPLTQEAACQGGHHGHG